MSTENNVRKGPGWITGAAGVAVVGGIAVFSNIAAGLSDARIDMTANNVHTLTDGTRRIMERVKSPTTIRFFHSPKDQLPPQLAPAVDQIEASIIRLKELNPDKITYKKSIVEQASDV